jgi:cytoskeletal protein RodZ
VSRSIGAYLRQQRQARGMAIDELEAITRIPRRSLERLEAGDFDARPDGFARGFVRTVAASLGLDPDDAVARMLDEPAPRERARRPATARALAALAAVLGAALLGAVLVWLASRIAVGEAPSDEGARVYRRDAVRSLAQEEARSEAR